MENKIAEVKIPSSTEEKIAKMLERYSLDQKLYNSEIEEFQKMLSTETDEYMIRHIKKMQLETEKALKNVNEKIESLKGQ